MSQVLVDLMDCIAIPKVARVERTVYNLALDYLTRCERSGAAPAENLQDFMGVLGMQLEEAVVVALNRAFEHRNALLDWSDAGALRLTPGRRDIWDFFNTEAEEEKEEYGAHGEGTDDTGY